MNLKSLKDNLYWKTIKGTAQKFIEDNPFQDSAAIAYYTIFSLPGVAMIMVTVAGSFYEQDTVRQELLAQISSLMGPSTANQVKLLMEKTLFDGKSLFMKAISLGTLVISATTVFMSLQGTLNSIWHIKAVPKQAIVSMILKRMLSLAMVASMGFIIMVSLMADTIISLIEFALSEYLSSISYYLFWFVNVIVTTGLFAFVFAFIYKVLPDADIKWRDVRLGAIVTTGLFILGKYLIGFYLGQSDLNDTYGAAGSLVILLTWVYYSVLILLFGAQFTFVYNKNKGRTIKPSKGAVTIEIKEIDNGKKPVLETENKKL